MEILTIGIPTYRRNHTLIHLLDQLNVLSKIHEFNVLIIDDGGIPNYELIEHVNQYDTHFKIVSNEGNLGYAKTFVKILELTNSKYLIMLEDDGEINVNEFSRMIDYLYKSDFVFATTPFNIKNDELNQSEYIRIGFKLNLKIWEFKLAAGHAPGLIYNTNYFKSSVTKLKEFNIENSSYFNFYPQLILYILTYATSEVKNLDFRFLNMEIAKVGKYEEPSGLLDSSGNKYFHPKSRLIQLIELLHFVDELYSKYPNFKVLQLKNALELDFFNDFKREMNLFNTNVYYQFLFKSFIAVLISPISFIKGLKEYFKIKKIYNQ